MRGAVCSVVVWVVGRGREGVREGGIWFCGFGTLIVPAALARGVAWEKGRVGGVRFVPYEKPAFCASELESATHTRFLVGVLLPRGRRASSRMARKGTFISPSFLTKQASTFSCVVFYKCFISHTTKSGCGTRQNTQQRHMGWLHFALPCRVGAVWGGRLPCGSALPLAA